MFVTTILINELKREVGGLSVRLESTRSALEEAQQKAVEQERLNALGQMASGIAHDFNNALQPVLGFSELLLKKPNAFDDKEKARHRVEVIAKAAKSAAALVHRLRSFYRARDATEALRPVDLGVVIRDAVSLTEPKWGPEAQMRSKPAAVRAEVADGSWILGNEAELNEALVNLIINALDASPEGGTVIVRTSVDGDSVFLEVEDEGIGMPEDVRQHCLEPFYSTKGKQGTGLGLAMVYGIARRHGAEMDIESTVGEGTTFRFRLPAAPKKRTGAAAAGDGASLPPLSVLLVEDDPETMITFLEYLESDGHRVETAVDGEDALGKFRAASFDVVVSDVAMPKMSGDDLAAAIKEEAPDTPVVLVSGFPNTVVQKGRSMLSGDMLMSKPVAPGALREAIAKVLRRYAGTGGSSHG
jgi:nitrogen-specific signal transduction histidine kinase